MGLAGFMSSHLTAAVTLLQCGPPLALYIGVIAPRSLLILITLASAFLWSSTLLLLSALLRGLLAGDVGMWHYAAIVVVAVVVEEAVRWWLYIVHRRGVRLLDNLASKNPSWRFTPADQALVAFAIGYGQAAAHTLVFSVSWLPLAAGKGVLYGGACQSMSYAPAAAFTMLGFFFLLAGSTLVAYDGWADGNVVQAAAPGAVHLVASLLTVLNVRHNSCAAVVAAELVLGCAMLGWAAAMYHRHLQAPGYSPALTAEPENESVST